MGTYTLANFRTYIRTDLDDAATYHTDAEIDRGVIRAVAELTRHHPRKRIYEVILDFDISAESNVLTGFGQDNAKSLTYKPVRWNSVSVTDATGATTYTEGTDYDIDYSNGSIWPISGGSIGATDTVLVTYSKSKICIDVSSLDILRINSVEYPVGTVPQKFISYEYDGTFVWLGSRIEGESQAQLSESQHVAIHYDSTWTDPGASTAGNYPTYLDNFILLIAESYCCLNKYFEYVAAANTQNAAGVVILTGISHTTLDALIADIANYLDTNSNNNAVEYIKDITDEVADLYTKIKTALDAANTALDEIDTSDFALASYGAEAILVNAYGKANSVNTGQNVAENLTEMSKAVVSRASARASMAVGYLQEVASRLSIMDQYVNQSTAMASISNIFARGAEVAVQAESSKVDEATGYFTAAIYNLEIADRYYNMYTELRNEAWAILRDPSQYSRDNTTTSVRQR